MTKKLTKALAITACAVILVAATVMGTVAYLTSQATVSNTFTAGNVVIRMDEAKADANGVVADVNSRTEVNDVNNYKLVPAAEYTKDAKIYVEANSEECYLFVKFDTAFISIVENFDELLDANNWKPLADVDGVYYYNGTIATSNTQTAKSIIGTFKVKPEADYATLKDVTSTSLKGYAIQKQGFGENAYADAWAAVSAAEAAAQPQG